MISNPGPITENSLLFKTFSLYNELIAGQVNVINESFLKFFKESFESALERAVEMSIKATYTFERICRDLAVLTKLGARSHVSKYIHLENNFLDCSSTLETKFTLKASKSPTRENITSVYVHNIIC